MKTAARERKPMASVPQVVAAGADRSGRALERPVRAAMESHFRHDFSNVRVHTNTTAAQAARSHDSAAFTIGHDIHFGAGLYQPHSLTGQQLLAHELTHVIQQQRSGQPRVQLKPNRTQPGNEDEREAEEAGRQTKPLRLPFFGRRGETPPESGTLPPEPETPQPVQQPAAATLSDPRAAVEPEDTRHYSAVARYLNDIRPRLKQLATAQPERQPWLRTDNPNVQAVFALVDQLILELEQQSLIVRFDKPDDDRAAASYDGANNVMSLRKFDDRAGLALVTANMLHEYVHVHQDRVEETQMAATPTPKADTAAAETEREIEARRLGVYLGEMLSAIGEPIPLGDMGERLGAIKFLRLFEQQRTGAAPEERQVATDEIRAEIEEHYEKQIAKAADTKSYVIEIDERNHALLHSDLPGQPTPIDFGLIPSMIADTERLKRVLAGAVRNHAQFQQLFDRPGEPPFTLLSITIAHGGKAIGSFAVEP